MPKVVKTQNPVPSTEHQVFSPLLPNHLYAKINKFFCVNAGNKWVGWKTFRLICIKEVSLHGNKFRRQDYQALSRESIVEELTDMSGILYDPDVVDVSIRLVNENKIVF